jgi:hypothetical protein
VLEACVLLGAVSPLLRYGPGSLVGRFVSRASSTTTPGAEDEELAEAVGAAITCAARHVPGTTCLARALAGWLMMTRRHGRATVRLGVNNDPASGFAAHAWLECNGRCFIGAEIAHEFTAFPPFS